MHNEDNYFDKEQLLNEVLKTKPGFILSENFADNLEKIAGQKMAWANYWSEFLVYLGAIAAVAAVWIAILFIWFEADWKKWLNFISGNLSLVAGIAILVVFVLFADRVLLRYFLNKSSIDIT